jgi:predicted TIM-barrel fold metal-dependent hydrolase
MPELTAEADLDAPQTVVTVDAHIGPRLKEDLRPYCPKKYLGEYDDFVRAYEPHSDPFAVFTAIGKGVDAEQAPGAAALFRALRGNACAGHHDVHERLRDMDRDGVAAEVIYHGSQNGQCFPFLNTAAGTFNALVFSPVASAHELELAAVGQRMYNEWLADQCSVEPERHAGLAHLPMWDIEAATAELERASSAGLRGINFPAPKLGIKPYDDPQWERFWSVCEERGMALCTHDGAGIDDVSVHAPHSSLVAQMEELQRKLLPRMVFGGLFERHPSLRLVLTELQQPLTTWWTQTAARYDELWEANYRRLAPQIPRKPSEYLRSNVFLGQSLLHLLPQEVTAAVRDGYGPNILWGSDYPHMEGSFRHPERADEETMTSLALRHAFSAIPPALASGMAGEHAVDVYGLDRGKLAAVARRIGAITARRLGTPPETVPGEWALIADWHVFPEYHQHTAA